MADGRTRIIKQAWRPDGPVDIAPVLAGGTEPEGFHVERRRYRDAATLAPTSEARVVSFLRGGAAATDPSLGSLALRAGSHVFMPGSHALSLLVEPGSELIVLTTNQAAGSRARGERLLVRNERFLSACATDSQMLRWILTPQYVSRRIFLHHDLTLVSRSGDPVSWFRTTMFDVEGLPHNEDGQSVFKMSYNSRTEFNVLYDVRGEGRVRFAEHPYADQGQAWGPWTQLDNEMTYHLCEPRELCTPRNKHEVTAHDGHVSLFCLFDPAPTGVERHQPGAYSDYEAYDVVSKREEFASHQATIGPFDKMVDALSVAEAQGKDWRVDAAFTEHREVFDYGLRAQIALEEKLCDANPGRRSILEAWRTDVGREPKIWG